IPGAYFFGLVGRASGEGGDYEGRCTGGRDTLEDSNLNHGKPSSLGAGGPWTTKYSPSPTLTPSRLYAMTRPELSPVIFGPFRPRGCGRERALWSAPDPPITAATPCGDG